MIAPASHWTDWAKWLALLTMTLDHLARFILAPSGHDAALWLMETLGRLAFPLFAGMIAWHALFDTTRPLRYMARLLCLALLAQVPFMLLIDTGGIVRLNVCTTLTLGLMVGWAGKQLVTPDLNLRARTLAATLGLIGLTLGYALDAHIEYGLDGVLLIPALMGAYSFLAQARRLEGLLMGLAAVWLTMRLNEAPLSTASAMLATLALLIVAARAGHGVPVLARWARLPPWLWRSFYPAHLWVLFGLVLLLEALT
ncbi:TraX family protein [Larsenimonas salina]|uniref:TraX family protein n=1 Tax=Larsenimonas salina TaxID=1295565 RepID=UPI002073F08D|nr:TraX family protein [Larsenimonas salina]MCM5704538.1 conjugal transfer protein TraX [Larsenimonas salina]